jgi:hypothetical protein
MTHEVNRGYSLEHDFSSMYTTVTFPIMHLCHGINDVSDLCHMYYSLAVN